MHPLLARQLRRLGLESSMVPTSPLAWQQFLERVERSYIEADQGAGTPGTINCLVL